VEHNTNVTDLFLKKKMLKLGNDRKGEANPLSLLNVRILLAAIRYVQSQDFKGEKERERHIHKRRDGIDRAETGHSCLATLVA